jgi:hypothetical protein
MKREAEPTRRRGETKESFHARLADYHDRHRGDVSLWEKTPVPVVVERGDGLAVFSLRMAPAELDAIKRAADRHEVTVSAYVRSALQRALYADFIANVRAER